MLKLPFELHIGNNEFSRICPAPAEMIVSMMFDATYFLYIACVLDVVTYRTKCYNFLQRTPVKFISVFYLSSDIIILLLHII